MKRQRLLLTLIVALAFLLPTLLGCSEKAPYGPAQVHFPEDEGAHSEAKVEWWYLNATVSDNQGHRYTAMLAYFNKTSQRPPLKIISIADLDAGVFHHLADAVELRRPGALSTLHAGPGLVRLGRGGNRARVQFRALY